MNSGWLVLWDGKVYCIPGDEKTPEGQHYLLIRWQQKVAEETGRKCGLTAYWFNDTVEQAAAYEEKLKEFRSEAAIRESIGDCE